MKLLKTFGILIVVVAIFGGAMFALNLYTGPIIAANNAGAANDRLNAVMPNATAYEDITETLSNVPESVTAVYKETKGLGYVLECTATSQYTGSTPMDIVIGVDAEGKICGIKLFAHSESKIFDENYPSTYLGKDSALTGVELFGGVTYSSKAFKGAVTEAMGVLISNNLITAGKKTPEQILTELIATVNPNMVPDGVLAATKLDVTGNIKVAYKSTNDTGYAYIMASGDASYLVIVNTKGEAKVYDVEGTDVTAQNEALVTEAKAHIENEKLAALKAVLPGATAFEEITATLQNLPASVKNVYKETSGLGYVAIATTTPHTYSSAPSEIALGVDANGKIAGVKYNTYNDTASPPYDLREKDNYLPSYIGKDSALVDIGLAAGSTFSSTAFKGAVSTTMDALVANGLIAEGVKPAEQVLAEMIPSLHTGLTAGGVLKAKEIPLTGNIFKGYMALNGSGFAFIMNSGDTKLLVLGNAAGVCKVVDTTGADVTAENEALCTEALAAAGAAKDFSATADNMIKAAFSDAEITPLALTTFSNVVYAASFQSGESTYYAFYSAPLTYEDNAMSVCTILDGNGAIVKQSVKQMAFGHGVEYMTGIKDYVDSSKQTYKDYLNKFNGLTDTSLSNDVLVNGATISTTAVKLATADAFAAFNSINNGGAQ